MLGVEVLRCTREGVEVVERLDLLSLAMAGKTIKADNMKATEVGTGRNMITLQRLGQQ